MGKKRVPSPTDEDFDRIAETLMHDDKFKQIKDYQSFDNAYRNYFEDRQDFLEDSSFEGKVFDRIIFGYDRVKDTRMVTGQPKKVRRGKKFYFMEVKDGKKVYTPVPKRHYEKHEYNFCGTQKGRVTYAWKDSFKIYSKTVTSYRGKNGQFVKIKK